MPRSLQRNKSSRVKRLGKFRAPLGDLVSGLTLKNEFERYDAQKKFGLVYKKVSEHSACNCDKVLRGITEPTDCKLFGKVCTPRSPVGPCMVSHEGACKIWHLYQVKKH